MPKISQNVACIGDRILAHFWRFLAEIQALMPGYLTGCMARLWRFCRPNPSNSEARPYTQLPVKIHIMGTYR